MTNLPPLHRFSPEEYSALQRKVALHSVPIGIIQDGQIGVASGILISIADKVFVATAGHNLLRDNDGPLYTDKEVRVITSKLTTTTGAPIIRMNTLVDDFSRTDVGYVEIAPGAVGASKAPLPLSDIYQNAAAARIQGGAQVFMHGYPFTRLGKKRLPLGSTARVPDSCGVLTFLLDPDERDGTFRMAFPKQMEDAATQEQREVDKPGGWSGSGVWLVTVALLPVWSVDVQLIGIETSYIETADCLRGSGLRAWLRLIKRDYPGLVPESLGQNAHPST